MLSTFITNITQIMDEIDTVERVCLLDTCLISRLENIYHKHNHNVIADFVSNDPIIITAAVRDELQLANTSLRYDAFFAQFPKVYVIDERDFFSYLATLYSGKQGENLFKKYSAEAFTTIQSFCEYIKNTQQNVASTIYNEYLQVFSSGKNKGEYSLLWLTKIIKARHPRISIQLGGYDKDLFEIYYDTFIKDTSLSQHRKKNNKLNISSLDGILQGLWRSGQYNKNTIDSYCTYYRDPAKKLYHYKINNGIFSTEINLAAYDNQAFVDGITTDKIVVVF